MFHGFVGLTTEFLKEYPGYSINPRRVNGSAVETLFSELKHTTGGNLTGANYETGKATMLTKKLNKGTNQYRSIKLYIRQIELLKKQRTSKSS